MAEPGGVVIAPVPQIGQQAHKTIPVGMQRRGDLDPQERFPRHFVAQRIAQLRRHRIIFDRLQVDKPPENMYKGKKQPLRGNGIRKHSC